MSGQSAFRIGVLGSGRGSNLVAIAKARASGTLPAELALALTDVPDAGLLQHAAEFGIPARFIAPGKFRTKLDEEAESSYVRALRDAKVDLVVLAGFMRVLHEPMLRAFPRRIINIHPSLLPKFPGLEAWKQALIAGETATGCTVHYVDERIDHGQILAQKEVSILPNDTAESLHARIQVLEHELYPTVIAEFCERYATASEQDGV